MPVKAQNIFKSRNLIAADPMQAVMTDFVF
jgi:hypothetical protein